MFHLPHRAVLINAGEAGEAGEAGDVVPGEPSLLINACDVARLSWRRWDKPGERHTV